MGNSVIEVTDAWVRPTASADAMSDGGEMQMGAETTAAYMTLTNTGEEDLRLVNVATQAANIVELHETTMTENDVMQMRPLADGVLLPAGESVELRPGGLHIMLLDLPEPLVSSTALQMMLALIPADADPTLVDAMMISIGVPVLEEAPTSEDLVITQAWVRPTTAEMDMEMAPGQNTAAYMLIENTGDEDITLVSGAADAAGIVEIHETTITDNDVMQMRPLADGITIAAGETVELRPGGLHVMLMDLQEPLVMGDALYLELTFDNEQTVALGLPIEDRMMGMEMMD